jgi:aconitase A
LVIDHSVQVDFFGTDQALEQNIALEFKRNNERYEFLSGQKIHLKTTVLYRLQLGLFIK